MKYLADQAGAYWLLDIIWSVLPKITDEFAVLELSVQDDRRARVRAVYQAVEPRGNPIGTSASIMDVPRDPPHLPEALKSETPTTRLVYLYLEPYGEVEVSVRQLEGLLGISHRNATDALQGLVELRLLEGLEPAKNRVGRYLVKQDGGGKA